MLVLLVLVLMLMLVLLLLLVLVLVLVLLLLLLLLLSSCNPASVLQLQCIDGDLKFSHAIIQVHHHHMNGQVGTSANPPCPRTPRVWFMYYHYCWVWRLVSCYTSMNSRQQRHKLPGPATNYIGELFMGIVSLFEFAIDEGKLVAHPALYQTQPHHRLKRSYRRIDSAGIGFGREPNSCRVCHREKF